MRASAHCRSATTLVLLGAAISLVAQTSEVFAPFVSGLRAVVTGAVVELSWRSSQDVRAAAHVFRSSAEIDAVSFAGAEQIAILPSGSSSYRDIPAGPGSYYYAVLLETPEGELYETFVAFRNKTSSATVVEREPTVEELAATVTELSAVATAEGVDVSFVTNRAERDMLLFRSESAMSSSVDLLTASTPRAVRSDAGTVADLVPSGGRFYAIVDAELFKLGRAVLVPGANTTVVAAATGDRSSSLLQSSPTTTTGAAVASRGAASTASTPPFARAASSRQAPLPFLQIARGVAIDAVSLSEDAVLDVAPDMSEVAAARDVRLSSDALAAVAALLGTGTAESASSTRTAVDVLSVDQSVSSGREDYGLQAVLHEDLLPGDYAAAIPRLRDYLTLRRSKATEARAHFYLAQALYFAGDYRTAMVELLLASDLSSDHTDPWIDATLAALRSQNHAG